MKIKQAQTLLRAMNTAESLAFSRRSGVAFSVVQKFRYGYRLPTLTNFERIVTALERRPS
jgi:hypothetical protein